MVNDLIPMGNYNGFVDLKILKGSHISGYDGGKLESWCRYYKNEEVSAFRKKIIVLRINESSILVEYNNLNNPYQKMAEKIKKEMDNYMVGLKNPQESSKLYAMNKELRKNMKKSKESRYEGNLHVLYELVNKVPQKFYSTDEEHFTYKEYFFNYKVLTIRVQIIPYVIQQVELGNMVVTKEEMNMVKALQEVMRVKDEKVTFDSYINEWVKRLLR